VGREHDPIARVGHRGSRQARQVGAPVQPPQEADIIRPRRPNGIQQRLHTRGIETGTSQLTATEPLGVTRGIGGTRVIVPLVVGLVVQVEYYRRVVLIGGRHRAPKCHRVIIGHGLLLSAGGAAPSGPAGSGSRGGFPRPVQIQNDVNTLPRAVIDDTRNISLVICLVSAIASKPIILVQGQTNDGAMPGRHRLGSHSGGVSTIASGGAFPCTGKL
jgi:hypothetical protein